MISDVHGNWQALEAVIADLGSVDMVICLGDTVGYGGNPELCCEEGIRAGWSTVLGNHDQACLDLNVLSWFNERAARSVRITKERLEPRHLDWLRGLPERAQAEGALLVHASPRHPLHEYIFDLPTAAANLAEAGPRICFFGHTHLPGVFQREDAGQLTYTYRKGKVRLRTPALVNPGSVGQPRDGDPTASYLVWEPDSGSVDFRRVNYDREAAKQAILEAGMPPSFASRLDLGR